MTTELVAETERIISEAQSRGLTLRAIGSVAVRLHSPGHVWLLGALGRRGLRDIDLMGAASDHRGLTALFLDLGYEPDPSLVGSHEYGIQRLIFKGLAKVDVFLDTLDMAHRIPLRSRLGLDNPTVGLADLLLSKLQVHEFTENDIKDVVVLMAEHDLGPDDREAIDVGRLVAMLRDDWGFWYEATQNVETVRRFVAATAVIPQEIGELVSWRLERMLELLSREPKSLRWRARSRLGSRVQWYQEVDDVER